jgi:hypothetical protein
VTPWTATQRQTMFMSITALCDMKTYSRYLDNYLRDEGLPVPAEDGALLPRLVLVARDSGERSTFWASNSDGIGR